MILLDRRLLHRASQFLWVPWYLGLVLGFSSGAEAAGPVKPSAGAGVVIASDPRIDLLSIVFHLAGNFEYNQDSSVPRYRQAVDSAFAEFRGHPAVLMAARLRDSLSVGFDLPMALAIHLSPPPELGERTPFGDAPALPRKWKSNLDSTRIFVGLLRRFYADAGVSTFFSQTRGLSDHAERDLRAHVLRGCDLTWFNHYFGKPAGTGLIVVPSLLNGGAQYGPRYVQADGSHEEAYAILGVEHVDAKGRPQFDQDVVPNLTHEIAHSYCNPLVDEHKAAFDSAFTAIYPMVSDLMKRQAYGPKEMAYESLVRATVVRFMATHGRPREAEAELTAQQAGGFYWIRELTRRLTDYERHRARYPTAGDFMPQLVAYFREVPGRLDRLRDQFESRRPKVVSMDPPDGAQGVDPAKRELVFQFDMPMDTTSRYRAIVPIRGDKEDLVPKILAQRFERNGKVLHVGVELASEREYEFAINTTLGGGYRSRSGIPAIRRVVRFRTGK